MSFLPHWKCQLSLIAMYLGTSILNGILIWLRINIFEDPSYALLEIGVFLSCVGCFIGFIYVLKKSDLLWSQPRYIRNYLLFLILPILFLVMQRQNADLELIFFYIFKIQRGIRTSFPANYPYILGRFIFHLVLPIMTIALIPGVFYRKKNKISDSIQRKLSIQNIFFWILLYFQLWDLRLNSAFYDEFSSFLFFMGFQSIFILGTFLLFWTPRLSHLKYLVFIAILLSFIDLYSFSRHNYPQIQLTIVYMIIATVIIFFYEFASLKNWMERLKYKIDTNLHTFPLSVSSTSSKSLVKKCIYCHSDLEPEKISSLTNLDFIYCPACGKKIMKHEIYPINEEELLAEHHAVLEKLDKTPSPPSLPPI